MQRLAHRVAPAAAGVLLVALALSPPATAQHPNHAQGFRPEHAFQLGELDHVNLFNGNLTVTIPIGPRFPLGPSLSYGLTLTYSGNVWEWEEECPFFPDMTTCYLQSLSRKRSNAGFGWHLGFGSMLAPDDPANTYQGRPVYVGPDQGFHVFQPRLHPNEALQSGSRFTQDGTYMRHKTSPERVEAPDGTIRTFTTLHNRPWLTRIEDPFGHWLELSYDEADYHAGSKSYLEWSLEDSHGRTHTVTLAARANGLFAAVTQVDFWGLSQPYTFSYSDEWIARACSVPASCTSNGCNQGDARVPLLTRVTLPDGSFYDAPVSSYLETNATCPSEARLLNGHLAKLKLPTGGALEWDWERVTFPQQSAALRPRGVTSGLAGAYGSSNPFRYAAGVSERRRVREGATVELGSWEYDRQLLGISGFADLGVQKVTVTHRPPGHTTAHYFSVYPGKEQPTDPDPPAGWTEHEYGLPFSRNSEAGSTGRFLSTQVHDRFGALVRSTYVEYERSGDSAANPRLKSQRTIHHDDAGRRADVVFSDFDGLGHFRTSVTSGTFSGQNNRTTTTNYNPGASVQTLPAAADPWVLGIYDLQTITEGGETVTREFDFRDDGYLRRQRIRENATRGEDDVVLRYVEDGSNPGFVRLEDTFGGADQSIEVGTSHVAEIGLPALPVYRQRHSYTCGVRSTTEWLVPSGGSGTPLSFLPLDLTVQCSTGRVTASRDTAGLQTTYTYDDLGRMTKVTPPGGAETAYTWSRNGTNNLPARVTVERKSGSTVLTEEQIRFDDFGRVALERRKMPDGTWAERETSWNAPGYVDRRSEWQAEGDPSDSFTVFGQYDPFGRPERITLPDGTLVTVEHEGEGSRTVSVPVATGLNLQGEPTFTTVSTTETYDRFGRLRLVDEPNGTRTLYAYDALDHLIEVRMNDTGTPTQVRTFDYDHRGYLKTETHPELGTSILYSEHDPLGNPGRIRRGGWDLGYSYDTAGRLVSIQDFNTTSFWKQWTYETGSSSGFGGKGKLASAIRHNRVIVPQTSVYTPIAVTEDYTYTGLGGRISRVETTVGVGDPGVPDTRPTFDYSILYDSLGNVSSRTYPSCEFNYCQSLQSTNPPRTVTAGFTQGLPTSIPGYASSFSYHPNGLLHQVTHANGVTDVQTNDPDDMQRPRSLHTTGASEDFATGVFDYDGAGNVTKMGTSRFTYDVLSRITSADVPVVGDGCTEDQNLQFQSFSGTVTLEVCGEFSLGPNVTVTSAGDVTVRAGERVVLNDGFQVDSGGRFVAEIDPSIEPDNPAAEAEWSGGYDRFGNLVSITTQAPGQSSVTRTPTANASTNRLNQVGTGYDLSGNVTSRAGWTYDHDAFNMLRHAELSGGEKYIFLYGPGDERLWTVDWTNGAAATSWVETWTLRDLDGSPLRQWRQNGGNTSPSHWSFEADHVYHGGGLLAAVTPQGTRHFHLDHLGTPRIVTDASGTSLAYHAYYPFGEEVTSVTDSVVKLQYTGHERDDLEAGADTLGDLDYMHARYHSPLLGRFMSPDPVLASVEPTRPQTWNRYSYVSGNPLKYIDPTGEILIFSGQRDDLSLVEEVANKKLHGVDLVIDKNGKAMLVPNQEKGEATPEQQAFADTLQSAIGKTAAVNINVVSGDPGVVFGQYVTGTIDIGDIAGVGDIPGISGAAILAGEIAEQNAAVTQTLRPTEAGHQAAHRAAAHAIQTTTGYRRIDQFHTLDTSGTGAIYAAHKQGNTIVGIKFKFVNGNLVLVSGSSN
jgi:RHS repeat-associated protein